MATQIKKREEFMTARRFIFIGYARYFGLGTNSRHACALFTNRDNAYRAVSVEALGHKIAHELGYEVPNKITFESPTTEKLSDGENQYTLEEFQPEEIFIFERAVQEGLESR